MSGSGIRTGTNNSRGGDAAPALAAKEKNRLPSRVRVGQNAPLGKNSKLLEV